MRACHQFESVPLDVNIDPSFSMGQSYKLLTIFCELKLLAKRKPFFEDQHFWQNKKLCFWSFGVKVFYFSDFANLTTIVAILITSSWRRL